MKIKDMDLPTLQGYAKDMETIIVKERDFCRDKIEGLEAKLAEAEKINTENLNRIMSLKVNYNVTNHKLDIAVDALEDHTCLYTKRYNYECPQCDALKKIKE